MALPEHHPTGKLRAIESLLDDEIFRSTENLQAEDLQLIGAIVQTYNFIELNLRRCISLFAHSGMMSSPRSSTKIGDLVVAVKAQVVKMDPNVEDISHSIAMLDEIELRRPFRNLLAHWAARRIVNQDAMILFSVDNKDAMRVNGKGLDADTTAYSIIDLADLRGLMNHLAPYERWMAERLHVWHTRYMPPRT